MFLPLWKSFHLLSGVFTHFYLSTMSLQFLHTGICFTITLAFSDMTDSNR